MLTDLSPFAQVQKLHMVVPFVGLVVNHGWDTVLYQTGGDSAKHHGLRQTDHVEFGESWDFTSRNGGFFGHEEWLEMLFQQRCFGIYPLVN